MLHLGHKWTLVGIEHFRDTETNIKYTRLKFKCRCEKLKTKYVEGHWTLEELEAKV
jgi:hypothetical protein